MSWQKPTADELWRAVDIYLATAYPSQAPSAAVLSRVELAKSAPTQEDLYACKAFERDAAEPPTRYSMRLGNASYPHMKMVIDRTPDGKSHLFRADTHDAHCLPPLESKEYAMVSALIDSNRKVAGAIESAWRAAGVPTFRGYLHDDLARCAAAFRLGSTGT